MKVVAVRKGEGRTAARERLAVIGLLVAMALSAIVTLILGRHLSFYADELDWLTTYDSLAPRSLLTPHNGHLIATTRLIYEVVPRGLGTSYLPFRLIDLAGVLASAALVFVFVRRRLGGPVALAPALVLLFFGSSHEIVLSSLGTPFVLSIALGLAAIVAFDEGSLARDRLGLLLLLGSGLSHTFGIVIAGGVAVQLASNPADRRRIWVALVPIVLWVAWWIWARQFHQGITSASNVPLAPLHMLESAGSAILALTGTGPEYGIKTDLLEHLVDAASVVIALAALGLLGLRIRSAGASARLRGALAMAMLFWLSIALSESPLRQPTTSRYQYFGAILVVLIAAEAFRGARIGLRGAKVLIVVLAVAIIGNGLRLGFGADRLTGQVAEVQAQIAMVEVAGESATSTFFPASVAPRGSDLFLASAGSIQEFVSNVGPLGFTLPEVRVQSEAVRADADFVLARAERLVAVPAGVLELGLNRACTTIGTGSAGRVHVPLGPGVQVVRQLEGPAQPLLVGRFADSASVQIGTLDPEADVIIAIPSDAAPDRWFTTFTGRVRICK